ncbi:MAG: ferrous iron transport protein A [Phycisphaerales bacterium JB037]
MPQSETRVSTNDQPARDAASPPAGRRLTTLARGHSAYFVGVEGDPADAASLRALGLRPNCKIVVRRLGEPSIIEVGGCCCGSGRRLGIARPLADRVLVADAPLSADRCDPA